MNSKGQVTQYVIIGILLVIAVGFLIYLTYSSNDVNIVDSKVDTKSFQLFMDSCLETSSRSSLKELGLHSGYLSVAPANSVQGIAVLDYQSLLPIEGTNSFTSQLESSIESKVSDCINLGNSSLPLVFTKGEPNVDVSYDYQGINIKLDFPIIFETSGKKESRNVEKNLLIPIKMRLFHLYIQDLLNNKFATPNFSISNNYTQVASYLPQFSVVVDNSTFFPYTLVSANSGDGFELLFLIGIRE